MTEREIDEIWDKIDDLMWEGRTDIIDTILQEIINKETKDVNELITYLTTTLPVKSKLKNRQALYDLTKKIVKERNEWEDNLLIGLE